MEIRSEYMEQALYLHRTCPVVDTHLDLAGELLLRKKNGEKDPLREKYLGPLRAGGFNLIVSSVYLEDSHLPEMGLRTALDQISVLLEEVDKTEEFMMVKTADDLDRAFREDRIGVLLYLEGMDFIGTDLRLLRVLWELGVRGASLTWSRRNALANGCCKAAQRIQIKGGLSPEGCQAIEEMERLGMFLDVSHLNDEGFEDVCRVARKPFIATHSNSRSVHFNYRNLTDEQMECLARQGGVMGLNNCQYLVGCRPGKESLEWMCRHVEHEVSLTGADKVGYGFDFCDSYGEASPRVSGVWEKDDCLGDHSYVPELTAALLQRGMAAEDVKKIIGGNFAGYFRRMLPEG